jgi:hypothetical protein
MVLFGPRQLVLLQQLRPILCEEIAITSSLKDCNLPRDS